MKTRRRTGPEGIFFHLTDEFVSPPEEFMVLLCRLHFGLPGGLLRAFWRLLEAFWEPKWYQNRIKIEVESEDEKKTVLGAPWIDFGSFGDCKNHEILLVLLVFSKK